MAKAKKLPSGAWRVLVYSHTDIDGKRKYESFTADKKSEAEYLAAEFARNRKEKSNIDNLTVKEGIDKYIESKDGILSPSTIREYKRSSKHDLVELHDVKYRDLTSALIQAAINTEAKTHSPKSVKNMYCLLSASLEMFFPDFKMRITLPQPIKVSRYVPSDNDIKELLKFTEGKEIEIPILLAATGSLRRSEIAALEKSDITDVGINVSKAMVQDENKAWVIKRPKTTAGYRFIPLPPEVIKKLKNCDDKITHLDPNQIYKRFKRALKECNIHDFRFHDLRHYYASVLHALGVPDKYIMQYGGWSSDAVLKNVYQHVMEDKSQKEQDKVISFFDTLTAKDV